MLVEYRPDKMSCYFKGIGFAFYFKTIEIILPKMAQSKAPSHMTAEGYLNLTVYVEP